MQDETPSTALGGIDEQTVADTALVVEALAAFAGPPDDLKTRRERRGFAPVFHVTDSRYPLSNLCATSLSPTTRQVQRFSSTRT